MAQQPRKPANFLQTALLFGMVFMGMQLLCNPMRSAADTRTSAQLFEKLKEDNAKLLDQTIVQDQSAYQSKLREEAEQQKLPAREVKRRELEAAVLVAHTQLKAGVRRNDKSRLDAAYFSYIGTQRSFKSSPLWTQPVSLPRPVNPGTAKLFPESSITPAELWQKLELTISNKSKTDLVWGILPGYVMIDSLVAATGRAPSFSYAFAALLLAVVVRAIVWPLTQRQLMWSRQMSQLQPLAKELKARYTAKDGTVDQQTLQVKTMELYREYGINPVAGCLPALAQLPLFLFVYQCMLQYRFEFRHGIFLWVNEGASRATNGFLAPNLGEMDPMLLVIYGISMIVTTLLAPVTDPSNARQQRIMGLVIAVVFTVSMFFYPLPSAFVLYWIFTNMLSTIQSLRAYRLPIAPLEKVGGPNGAALPKSPFWAAVSEQMGQQPRRSQGTEVDPKTNGKPAQGFTAGKTGTPRIQKPKKRR